MAAVSSFCNHVRRPYTSALMHSISEAKKDLENPGPGPWVKFEAATKATLKWKQSLSSNLVNF